MGVSHQQVMTWRAISGTPAGAPDCTGPGPLHPIDLDLSAPSTRSLQQPAAHLESPWRLARGTSSANPERPNRSRRCGTLPV